MNENQNLVELVNNEEASLREDFGPDAYDDLLRYAAVTEVLLRQSQAREREMQRRLDTKDAVHEIFTGLTMAYAEREGLRKQARAGGAAKHAKDPKQAALKKVRQEWENWRHKRRYKAAFARDMLEKHPILESTKTIEDKCRAWEKEAAIKV